MGAMDGEVWLLRGSPEAAAVPRLCACCGAAATHSMRERRLGSTYALLVPYCGVCHRHAAEEGTRTLALSVSTVLVAATLTAGLPLALSTPSLPLYGVLVLAGTAVPLVASRFLRSRSVSEAVSEGHATSGRATQFRFGGAIECRSRAFAEALSAASGVPAAPARPAPFAVAPWAVLAVLLCFALVVPLYRFHYPVVRVVNASGEALTVVVDGRSVGRVPSTERESEFAGVELRVPAGERLVQAFDPAGKVVDAVTVEVEAGAHHLYAPGSSACFRIETTGFGQRAHEGTSTYPLVGPPNFWVLPSGPEAIDYWFAPAPPPAADSRSTGGLARALRQGACVR